MKKQELIHLHGLLSEVRSEYDEWGTDIDLTEYKELGVKPTSIHRSKTDHKAAVFKLASGITSSAEEETTEPVAPRAD
ncbi:UPF0058 family protein [Halobaculum rubrum]|uniref:UPF0058 family protein n=1 Tax=Halobaculum rubrum TaxID=2872158 RepID=UPI001CA44E82|nr:UPF0058 family protein [Halobaculum rubrum]QZX99443.1 UPF0058 family protein [Halobaculum rubrum]